MMSGQVVKKLFFLPYSGKGNLGRAALLEEGSLTLEVLFAKKKDLDEQRKESLKLWMDGGQGSTDRNYGQLGVWYGQS